MRRRDWLKSLAVLAAVPMIGVRKAVASAEAVPETLPAVAPPPPAAEPVAEPSLRVWPPEAIWINDEPSHGAMAFGGPKDGEVMPGWGTKYRCCPVARSNPVFDREYGSVSATHDIHQYSRERIDREYGSVSATHDIHQYSRERIVREYGSVSATHDIHQYSRERIVLSTPNVRIFIDVWCYCGTGYSMRATTDAKAAALKWAHRNYGHLIRDPDVSADGTSKIIGSIARHE
jgi:hypothetical protein